MGVAIFLSLVDSSACPWDFSTVEQVGMSLYIQEAD